MPSPRVRWGVTAVPAVAAGIAWVAASFGVLALPGVALSARDIPLFRLPLQVILQRLAAGGQLGWNPWLEGGQPVLSNPNYAAFYPLNWAVLPLPAAYSLNILVLVHAAIAFAGAWQLARRLGVGRGAALLAACGYSGCGAMLSLVSAFSMFCSMAWFPWVLRWGDQAFSDATPPAPMAPTPVADTAPVPPPAPPARTARPARPATWAVLLAGAALAIQILAGMPEAAAMSCLALAALALTRGRRASGRAILRLAAIGGVALALSAVQLLPTAARLRESPRAGGLPLSVVTLWSAPPVRLVELVAPRFLGNPGRTLEGLFFGWGVHDRGYPYILSLYPGLLLAVLGLTALGGSALGSAAHSAAGSKIPLRAFWVVLAGAAVFLGCGRHNPLYAPLLAALPPLGGLRYPEKFTILLSFALVFAGALGWQRLLREREAGNLRAANQPLGLALLVLVLAAAWATTLYAWPAWWLGFVHQHSQPPVATDLPQRGLELLRAEAIVEVASAAAVVGLLVLCRSSFTSSRRLTLLAALLLAGDLLHYGRGLIPTVPAAEYGREPLLARQAASLSGRIYAPPSAASRNLVPQDEEGPEANYLRLQLGRLQPYSGILWDLHYAFHLDFDRFLTRWGSRAARTLDRTLPHQQLAERYLSAWNVAAALRLKSDAEWAADLERDRSSPSVALLTLRHPLPRLRFVPRATFHDTWDQALAAAAAEGFDLASSEHCARRASADSQGPPRQESYAGAAALESVTDRGARIEIRYRAATTAFLVVADTFDDDWTAALGSAPGAPGVHPTVPVTIRPTAACQLGIQLPAGEHQLVLLYRDPRVTAGAALSFAAAVAWATAMAWAALRSARRRGAGSHMLSA